MLTHVWERELSESDFSEALGLLQRLESVHLTRSGNGDRYAILPAGVIFNAHPDDTMEFGNLFNADELAVKSGAKWLMFIEKS